MREEGRHGNGVHGGDVQHGERQDRRYTCSDTKVGVLQWPAKCCLDGQINSERAESVCDDGSLVRRDRIWVLKAGCTLGFADHTRGELEAEADRMQVLEAGHTQAPEVDHTRGSEAANRQAAEADHTSGGIPEALALSAQEESVLSAAEAADTQTVRREVDTRRTRRLTATTASPAAVACERIAVART